MVDGLHYELRQRDLRLAEKDRYIAQLEQQISEFKASRTRDAPAGTACVYEAADAKAKTKVARSSGRASRCTPALRPAAVMRKITGGNRSQAGAEAWAKLPSLMATADHKKLGVYDATKNLIIEY